MRILFALLLSISAAPGAPPEIRNGRVEPRSLGGSLEQTIAALAQQSAEPHWAAWTVSSPPRAMGGDCGYCSLEGQGRDREATAPAAGPSEVAIFVRLAERRIDKVRFFRSTCPIDASGRTVYLLSGVSGAASVAWLEARETPAVAAVAMHAAPEADAALERLAAPSRPEKVRRDAIFWLGNSRGRRGLEAVRRALRDDPSDAVRRHAVFAMSLSKEPEALPALFDLARKDASPGVRSQALFWIAQRAAKQAAELITEAIEKDPDTEVKRQAVFSLSRLPKDEGIPRLIDVARKNPNPAVRKQAMFWLGQSKDPRALSFFEEVLARR